MPPPWCCHCVAAKNDDASLVFHVYSMLGDELVVILCKIMK